MPALGFGTATLGRETNEDESRRILDAAYALGIRHFDTAEAYGGGNARLYRQTQLGIDDVREASGLMHSSEIILGRWVRERGIRQEVTLATKTSNGRNVSASLQRSLARMGLDAIDIYYLHSIPADVPLRQPLAEMEEAPEIGAVGVCNATRAQLAEARAQYGQSPFSLAQPSVDLLSCCREEGVQFVAYSPLAAGFLTGKYGARGELQPQGTRFDVIPGHRDLYFHEAAFAALARLEALAQATGLTKSLLALAWVLRHADISVVLVGATRVEHLHNAARAQQLKLDEELWQRL